MKSGDHALSSWGGHHQRIRGPRTNSSGEGCRFGTARGRAGEGAVVLQQVRS